MAKKHHGHKKKKIPLFATGGALVQGMRVYGDYNAAVAGKKTDTVLANMGIAKGKPFAPVTFLGYWSPALVGVVASAAASKFGLNKYMARVPIVNF